MRFRNKISSSKYEKDKQKYEEEKARYNQRQEELDNMYKKEKQKSTFKSLLSNLKFETYTKRLVAIIVFIGLLDLQLSYILAFLGKEQIAETLSTQICITLLGTVLVYIVRAYFDTKAEKRDEMIKSGLITDKKLSDIADEAIKNKIKEVIKDSGLSDHIKDSKHKTENPEDSKN